MFQWRMISGHLIDTHQFGACHRSEAQLTSLPSQKMAGVPPPDFGLLESRNWQCYRFAVVRPTSQLHVREPHPSSATSGCRDTTTTSEKSAFCLAIGQKCHKVATTRVTAHTETAGHSKECFKHFDLDIAQSDTLTIVTNIIIIINSSINVIWVIDFCRHVFKRARGPSWPESAHRSTTL